MPFHVLAHKATGKFRQFVEDPSEGPIFAPDGYDPEVYEEIVQLEPPDEANREPRELSLPEQLDAVFSGLPVAARAQFYPLKAAVKLALDLSDTAAAREIINQTTVPEELVPVKTSLLDILDAHALG